ncbi:Uu.00g129620.m01.CDS01 [Anthostomella pinea]|uniref:Uu.00g129620.m01.CDS01 n=1 Tax=Anthostomella pinea TaxID=933095 RepID=A0AAI8VIJ7_9PEZI|nr:Uu.00g129620.m01.CDS01 [Anthostomella pinea]
MASRKFVDPMTLLQLAPVISSSCSLWYSRDQQFFLSNLIQPKHHNLSNQILPPYFQSFFWPGTAAVVGLLGTTFWSSMAVLRFSGTLLRDRDSFNWYVAGASFAAGHLLFVPLVAPHVKAIFDDRKDGNVDELRGWLRVNAIRTLTVDLAAWACCVVAAVKTFSP